MAHTFPLVRSKISHNIYKDSYTLMNLPLLPTDNLYKFMSLAGAVIIILSVIYPIIQIEELQHRIVSLNGEEKILDQEIEFIKHDVKFLEKNINILEKKKNQKIGELNELLRKSTELSRKTNEQQIKNIELFYKKQDIELTSKYISQNRILGFIGTGFGSFLAFFGFYLWYVRIQKLQDLLLKRQVTSDKEIKP